MSQDESKHVPDPETSVGWLSRIRSVRFLTRFVLLFAIAAGVAWRLFFVSISVPSYTVESRTLSAEVMGTGTLEARTSAIVGPKIGGLITHVAADQGDQVQAAALLFQLEDSDIDQQVGMAESEVSAADATLDRLKAAQNGARAVLAQARTDHDRVVALAERNAASKRELDKALESLSVAQAEVSIARASIIEGRKHLEAAKRSLDFQRARLQDATIEAPFDGLIIRRDRDVGDVVAPGASVFAIVSTDEMWISAWVDETELARLREGQLAQILFRAEPSRVFPGSVVRVGREVDRETREVLVDVRLDRLPENWAIGQRAEVYIVVDQHDDARALPARLVLIRDGQTGVMFDDGGRARWRKITLGLRGREFVEILEGLSVGDRVLNPTGPRGNRLREGRRITTR